MAVTTQSKISRDDIEAKFRELQGEAQVIEDDAKNYAVTVAAVVVVAVVVGAFLLGRRKGRHLRTIVEVRRV